MGDPYKIEGPALISFSGGRSSGYMLKHILDAHGGTLPDDVKVTFANTGKEMPETLDFVQECSERWDVPIDWVQARPDAAPDYMRFEIVSHNSAARDGEPYRALINKKGYLPNPVTRYCTFELKIRPMKYLAQARGWNHWTVVIGLRADEQRRVARARARARADSGKEPFVNVTPMADAGVSRADVTAWWKTQPFNLRLPSTNGSTPLGNCDLCFLKGGATLFGIIRDRPDLAQWWIEAEAEARASKPSGARFRSDRPSYADMLKLTKDQGDMLDNNSMPCECHD